MSVVGFLADVLMIIVILIAAGSLVIAATIPLGAWLQKRRDARIDRNPPAST